MSKKRSRPNKPEEERTTGEEEDHERDFLDKAPCSPSSPEHHVPPEESVFYKAQQENWAGKFAKKSESRIQEEKEGRGPPVRVYSDGIFDLFHYGHAKALEQAKKLFPNAELVVGVCSDEDTRRIKGLTVMTSIQRCESVRHCRWADEVIQDAPWVVTPEYIKEHRLDYIVHGEDLSTDAEGNDAYHWLKEAGLFKTIKRTDGISTSDIILKIVRDYDRYVRRNLNRGYSRKDMNVSFMKETQIHLQDSLSHLQEEISEHVHGFLSKFNESWHKLVSPSIQEEAGDIDQHGDQEREGKRRK